MDSFGFVGYMVRGLNKYFTFPLGIASIKSWSKTMLTYSTVAQNNMTLMLYFFPCEKRITILIHLEGSTTIRLFPSNSFLRSKSQKELITRLKRIAETRLVSAKRLALTSAM